MRNDGFSHFSQNAVVWVNEDAEVFRQKWEESRQGSSAQDVTENKQAFLSSYEYFVLGGQHQVAALQKNKENKIENNDALTNMDQEKMCAVYGRISEACRAYLSHKHQGIGQKHLSCLFQDFIGLCRLCRNDFRDEYSHISKRVLKENFFLRYPIDDVINTKSGKRDRNALLLHLAVELSPKTWEQFTKWLNSYEGDRPIRKELKPSSALKWSGIDHEVLREGFKKMLTDPLYTLERSQKYCWDLKKMCTIRRKTIEFSGKTHEELFEDGSKYAPWFTDEALRKEGLLKLNFIQGKAEADSEIRRYLAMVEAFVSGTSKKQKGTFVSPDGLASAWFCEGLIPNLEAAKDLGKDAFKGTNLACFDLLDQWDGLQTHEEKMKSLKDLLEQIHLYNNHYLVKDCDFLLIANPLQLAELLALFPKEQVKSSDCLFTVIGDLQNQLRKRVAGNFNTSIGILRVSTCLPEKSNKGFQSYFETYISFADYLVQIFSKPHQLIIDCTKGIQTLASAALDYGGGLVNSFPATSTLVRLCRPPNSTGLKICWLPATASALVSGGGPSQSWILGSSPYGYLDRLTRSG